MAALPSEDERELAMQRAYAAARLLFTHFKPEQLLGAPITAVLSCDGAPTFTTGDGVVHFMDKAGCPADRVQAHDGVILAATVTACGTAVLTGGDDGAVRKVERDGTIATLAQVKRGWIEHLVSSPRGDIAWAAGRNVTIITDDGVQTIGVASTCGGLSFAGKVRRLAIAYHGGVIIATGGGKGWTQTQLEWPGSHIGVTWSPGGRFLMSAMQNNALHGWRIADSANIHINGLDGKPRSLSWSKRGHFLASSGGNGALLWSFRGKDGPIGQRPMQAGARGRAVTAVAFHPSVDLLAIGYGDGVITIVRWADEMMMVVRSPDGRPIEQLLWAPDGAWLAFGADEGIAGVVKADWIARVAHGRV